MRDWAWVSSEVVLAFHEEQLAQHGGPAGVRDSALLASALDRARNKAAYDDDADAASLAAAYAFAIVRNHPFVDGNERTALVAAELFLTLNGLMLDAADADCVVQIQELASGRSSEAAFTAWVRAKLRPAE